MVKSWPLQGSRHALGALICKAGFGAPVPVFPGQPLLLLTLHSADKLQRKQASNHRLWYRRSSFQLLRFAICGIL